MGVQFRVLGPVDVIADGSSLPVPGGKLTTLLAGLLLRANRMVSTEQLTRWLWDAPEPDPRRAKATLHEYVRRLRRVLGSDDVIRTLSGGYLIQANDDSLDLLRFRTLAARGRTAAEAGELRAAAERLTAALELWRGPALANVDSQTLHDDEVTHLTELRLLVQEHWADVALGLGEHQRVIVELRGLIRDHPLREKPWEQLMIALYRDHRRAEALAAYDEIRNRLVEELGVDPGASLLAVHQAILRGDPSLDPEPLPPRPATGVAPEPPRQLPADISHFIGRAPDLTALAQLVGERRHRQVNIAAIEGAAGVGKTTLAVHFAHRIADEFPGGQLFINLRGHGPGKSVPPAAALENLLQMLGAREQVPTDTDARAALWRTHTAGRRLLVVLDNARDTEQVRPLLPGTGCLALVTSRAQLRGLIAREGANRVALDRLQPTVAVDLLASVVGTERIRHELQAAHRIVEACARLPLAIRILGERISRQPGTQLAEILDELDDEQDRLTIFDLEDDEDTNLRAVFNRSYRSLEPDAARLFRVLGPQPVVDFTAPAAAAAAGIPVRRAAVLLDKLAAVHLLEQRRPHRYQFHDLMREFATGLANRGDEPAEPAIVRLLDWYLYSALNADRRLAPQRRNNMVGPAPPNIRALTFGNAREALEWCDAERLNLFANVDYARDRRLDWYGSRLPWVLLDYLIIRAFPDQWVAVHQTSLAASRRIHDRHAEAHALNGLGIAHSRLNRDEEATNYLREALSIRRELGDDVGTHLMLTNLAIVYERLGRYRESIEHGEEAVRLARTLESEPALAGTLIALCRSYLRTTRLREAMELAREAQALLPDEDSDLTALTFRTLGTAYAKLGDRRESAANYRRAIEMYRNLDLRFDEAETLIDLGDLHAGLGDPASARECWHRALAVHTEARHPQADQVLDRLLRLDSGVHAG